MSDIVDASFDMEQGILGCWNITSDLEVLAKSVMEDDSTTKDQIANVLIGLKALYDMRFDQTFRLHEEMHHELCMLKKSNGSGYAHQGKAWTSDEAEPSYR